MNYKVIVMRPIADSFSELQELQYVAVIPDNGESFEQLGNLAREELYEADKEDYGDEMYESPSCCTVLGIITPTGRYIPFLNGKHP